MAKAGQVIGKKTEAYSSNPSDLDKIYEFRYKVVDIGSLIPSHTDAFAANPKYPSELQPRVRDRAASKIQIENMATNLNPRVLLTDSGFLDTGPMIVGSDNVVESGNGRILALRKAYNDKSSRYNLYKNMLVSGAKNYGLKSSQIEAMETPVLVRERITKVNRVNFTREANESGVLAMSPFEQALVDSKRLSGDIIRNIEIGESQTIDQALKSRRNDHIVSHFLQTVPQNERAMLADSKGGVNQSGINRLKTAIFAKTYPGEAGERLTRTFSESVEPGIKTIENAMFQTLPEMAKAESLISTGKREANLSISKDLAAAIDAYARVKETGKLTIADYLQQSTMFGDELSPLQKQILQHFDTMGSRSKMVREFMGNIANKIIDAPIKGQSGMFGIDSAPKKEELVNSIINKQRDELGKDPVPAVETKGKKESIPSPAPEKKPIKASTKTKGIGGSSLIIDDITQKAKRQDLIALTARNLYGSGMRRIDDLDWSIKGDTITVAHYVTGRIYGTISLKDGSITPEKSEYKDALEMLYDHIKLMAIRDVAKSEIEKLFHQPLRDENKAQLTEIHKKYPDLFKEVTGRDFDTFYGKKDEDEEEEQWERGKRPTANELNEILKNGGNVQVTTYLKSTVYGPKHAGMFFEKGRDLCVKRGKSSDQLSIGNILLVSIKTTGGIAPKPAGEETSAREDNTATSAEKEQPPARERESRGTVKSELDRLLNHPQRNKERIFAINDEYPGLFKELMGMGIDDFFNYELKGKSPENKPKELDPKKILTTYFRPEAARIPESVLNSRLEEFGGKQIDRNMWKLRTKKSIVMPHIYETQLVIRRSGEYFMFSIPTDENGHIPQITMAERLLDTKDGSRKGTERDVWIDCSVDALNVVDPKDQAKSYYWFLFPNETDVKFIDDSNTKIIEFIGKGAGKGGGGGRGKKIRAVIVGGTMTERAYISDNLKNNFTIAEKNILNNCLIEIQPDTAMYAGGFQGRTDSAGNIIGTSKIVITKSYVRHPDAIVHEAVHALRKFDKKRDPRLKHVTNYSGKDADLEESMTEAETVGRENPLYRGKHYQAGYYHHINVPNKTNEQLVTEDRVTITGGIEKPQKGKRVQKSVLLKYPATHISKLKIQGNAEAVDTFYEIERSLPSVKEGKPTKEVVSLHLYNPAGTTKTDDMVDRQLKNETPGEIKQFHDGKAEVIRKAKKMPSIKRTKPREMTSSKSKLKGSKRIGPYVFNRGTLRRA